MLPRLALLTLSTAGSALGQVDPLGLTDGTNDPSARFGRTVALDGDVAVVGAPGTTAGGVQAGAVYVFERLGTSWTPTFSAQGVVLDQLGFAVEVEGDRFAVGRRVNSGSVDLYVRSGTNWALETTLSYPGEASNYTGFGEDIDLDGDSLVIGARSARIGGRILGAAYVYRRVAGEWTLQAELAPRVDPALGYPRPYTSFGEKVAIDGDRVVVGRPGALPSNVYRAGEVSVFERIGGTWAEVQLLTAPQPTVNLRFGAHGLELEGDRCVISAIGHVASGLARAGAVYVAEHNGLGWSVTSEIVSTTPTFNGFFGIAVALDGDVLSIGAIGEDGVGPATGRVVTLRRGATGTWAPLAEQQDPRGTADDEFGLAVATDSGRVLIGAPDARRSGVAAGIAFVGAVDQDWGEVARQVCEGTYCRCTSNAQGVGCPNSHTSGAAIDVSGSTSVTGDDLGLAMYALPPGALARVAISRSLASPAQAGDGALCLTPRLLLPIRVAGATGIAHEPTSLIQRALQAFGPFGAIMVGETWTFQAVYDDPAPAPMCSSGVPGLYRLSAKWNATSAVQVTFTP